MRLTTYLLLGILKHKTQSEVGGNQIDAIKVLSNCGAMENKTKTMLYQTYSIKLRFLFALCCTCMGGGMRLKKWGPEEKAWHKRA